MIRNQSFRTSMRPTPVQAKLLRSWCDTARFVWNVSLRLRRGLYEIAGATVRQQYATDSAGNRRQDLALQKLMQRLRDGEDLTDVPEIQALAPDLDPFLAGAVRADETWLSHPAREAWKAAPASVVLAVLLQQDRAMQATFRRLSQGKKPGFPRFKSRTTRTGATVYGTFHVESDRIKLPKLGWVRLAESGYVPETEIVGGDTRLRPRTRRGKELLGGRIVKATLSEEKSWKISVACEVEVPDPVPGEGTVALHPGVRVPLTVGDGRRERRRAPRATDHRLERQIVLWQRRLSRRQKGSRGRREAVAMLRTLWGRAVAQRRDHARHSARFAMTSLGAPGAVIIQDWDVKSMLEDWGDDGLRHCHRRDLHRRIAGAGMASLLERLRYKAEWAGADVVDVPRTEPVSICCSACGHLNQDFPPTRRVLTCEACGVRTERETNAIRNLLAYAAGAEPGQATSGSGSDTGPPAPAATAP